MLVWELLKTGSSRFADSLFNDPAFVLLFSFTMELSESGITEKETPPSNWSAYSIERLLWRDPLHISRTFDFKVLENLTAGFQSTRHGDRECVLCVFPRRVQYVFLDAERT